MKLIELLLFTIQPSSWPEAYPILTQNHVGDFELSESIYHTCSHWLSPGSHQVSLKRNILAKDQKQVVINRTEFMKAYRDILVHPPIGSLPFECLTLDGGWRKVNQCLSVENDSMWALECVDNYSIRCKKENVLFRETHPSEPLHGFNPKLIDNILDVLDNRVSREDVILILSQYLEGKDTYDLQ